MSRRFVKNATVDSANVIKPKVIAVVSTGNNLQSESESQSYFKRNYLEVLRKITPTFYFADDRDLSGVKINELDQLINSHMLVNNSINTVLPMSALTYDSNLSALNTPAGFAKYFYKQNSPASIASDDFERTILKPLGKQYSDYDTSTAFLDYVSGTLLHQIPSLSTTDHNLADLTLSAFTNESSSTYSYLARNLGWVYFLNRDVGVDTFNTSNAVATMIAQNLWRGHSIELMDSINIFQEYLWRKENISPSGFIPVDYISGTNSSGTFVSGVQLLDRLKTLNEVVYSPHYLDSPDRKVEDSFVTYLATSSLITTTEEAGDFTKFLRGISFSLADRVTEGNEINALYDIAQCPDQYLELLAELIGWRLLGADVDKWRVQLRNAVQIYKKKGTRRSIQILLDTLFSAGVFDATTSDVLTELWESYIPDIIYYSLATSSAPFADGFTSYTPELAHKFGVPYSKTSMDTNIKYIVDKILFDLVREYPNNFRLGKEPFHTPRFVLSGTDEIYEGPYHRHEPGTVSEDVSSIYMTGEEHTGFSTNLELKYDPDFTFFYRDKINYIPPYEKRQYYTPTDVTPSLLDRIEALLNCYGVDSSFSKSVTDYIRSYTTQTVDPIYSFNGFLVFTKEKKYPLNYEQITKNSTKERDPDPLSLLSMWSGKSSHFYLSFDASSFNWKSSSFESSSHYGLKQVQQSVDQVIPAHAIPATLLTVSTVADSVSGVKDNDCREVRPNFNDLYEGSSTVTTNFGVTSVNMNSRAVAMGISPNRFVRGDVESPNDYLFASAATGTGPEGAFDVSPATSRNSLRRRNYRYLLPETKMFTRIGRNSPGNLSASYEGSGYGYIPLGFVPSTLSWTPVALKSDDFGSLIDETNLHGIWGICQNLLSTSSYSGYMVSNTFAFRAKEDITSSDCNAYGRRGQLPEILYVMNKLNDKKKYLQASSIVSGYIDPRGDIDPLWPSSSTEIVPNDLSAWYSKDGLGANVVRSIANQLIRSTSANDSLSYMENFEFGRNVNTLFNSYNLSSKYAGHGIRNNYNQLGGPNIFSHTYGPLLYNSDFEIDGSSIAVSSFLQASSAIAEADISFFGGSGVLSLSGASSVDTYVGTITASDSDTLYLGYSNVSSPEFRNGYLVSGVELVDTSTPFMFTQHPIFSIFRLARKTLSKFDFSNYLIENTVIKYQRSSMRSTFPRLRIKIDNSDTTDSARNFLEPNHTYEIKIVAHNLAHESTFMGGQSLGVWIHTEPEDGKVWTYRPYGYPSNCPGRYIDAWEQMDASSFNSDGISIVESLADVKDFPVKPIGGRGLGKTNGMDEIGEERSACWDTIKIDQGGVIKEVDTPAMAKVTEDTRTVLTFRLTTNNDKGSHPSLRYEDLYGPINRLDQKYVIEIFTMKGNADQFVVFEDISIQDITNKEMAIIPSTYGDIHLDDFDLKTIFRFWKNMKKGIASRTAVITSGTMEASGGSRMNYRSNVGMYDHTYDTAIFNALAKVVINEG